MEWEEFGFMMRILRGGMLDVRGTCIMAFVMDEDGKNGGRRKHSWQGPSFKVCFACKRWLGSIKDMSTSTEVLAFPALVVLAPAILALLSTYSPCQP